MVRILAEVRALALRYCGGCLLAAAVACCLGCSSRTGLDENRKPVHPVRGKVSFQGKSAEGAFVLFTPVNEPADAPDPRPRANVGADGTFTLSTYGENDGAPAGNYVVAVSWENSDTHEDKLRGRYSGAASRLRAKVVEGTNELPPFDLK